MRILFIIRSLGTGGAERQLLALTSELVRRDHAAAIAVMYGGGAMEGSVAPGVRLIDLAKGGRWELLGFAQRAARAARDLRADVVHGYMTGANEVASVVAALVGRPSVWGIRVSDQDFTEYSRFRSAVFGVSRAASRVPRLIIANSEAGRAFHEKAGYPARRMIVIPNGIDTVRFAPDPAAGLSWRQRNGYEPGEPLVVLPARIDPMKDHRTFVRAIVRFRALGGAARFAAVGNGSPQDREGLEREIADAGVADVVRVLPAERDVSALYSAASIVTLTSRFGEGFPNVLGESMACGTPCVATASGDSRIVLGDTGVCVDTGDADGLAAGWLTLLDEPADTRARRAANARNHIVERFSVSRLGDRTESALRSILLRQGGERS